MINMLSGKLTYCNYTGITQTLAFAVLKPAHADSMCFSDLEFEKHKLAVFVESDNQKVCYHIPQ